MSSSSAKPIGFQDINLDHFHFNMVMSKQKPLLRDRNIRSDKAEILYLALARTYFIPGKIGHQKYGYPRNSERHVGRNLLKIQPEKQKRSEKLKESQFFANIEQWGVVLEKTASKPLKCF